MIVSFDMTNDLKPRVDNRQFALMLLFCFDGVKFSYAQPG